MPSAVSKTEETTKFNLKSCEGGEVELRRMTYGQIVQRRALSKMNMIGKGRTMQAELAMANAEITQFEFSHCIVDHNLEDETGRKLNLAAETDFNRLDPRIGQEIEGLIGDMNNFDEETQGN